MKKEREIFTFTIKGIFLRVKTDKPNRGFDG